jgi:glycosyltransferase involved in cell wall biosynthesis
MTEPAASVVIPAHDEADGIASTLGALTRGRDSDALDIVVVCNGCSDDTARVARRAAQGHVNVRVVELQAASKVAALRQGDQMHGDLFPRIYLDADVELDGDGAIALADALRRSGALVAGVRARLDLRGVSKPARWFHSFAYRLPVFDQGIIGAGVYALSAQGHARFGVWPDVLGDDQFVYRLYTPEERVFVDTFRTVVWPTPTLRAVVSRGVRVRQGNQQLSTVLGPGAPPAPSAGFREALALALRRPRGWLEAVTFVVVTVLIRLRTRVTGGRGDWQVTR